MPLVPLKLYSSAGTFFYCLFWFVESAFIFNLFVAFCIDIFNALEQGKEGELNEKYKNFMSLHKHLFKRGLILHKKEETRALQER